MIESFRPGLVAVWLINYLKWRLLGLRVAPDARGRGIPKLREHARIERPRGVWLGRDVTIRPYAFLRSVPGELRIDAGTYVGDFTIINSCESIRIGRRTTIAPSCHITDANHGFARGVEIQGQAREADPVVIGDDVWLGAGVKVLAGVSIGNGAVVGAGAVVTRDVEADCVVAGVPAQEIGERPEPDRDLS
jgi:serine acetyltransferase